MLVQYAIAFGLALLLNAEIRARKFFRVAFLLPFMLSPVAVSWMIGKSIMEYRFGPLSTLARHLGWESPAFFASPWIARFSIMAMDAWVSIPFMMILLLAGLQALPKEVLEAAKVDGASGWQAFWQITFPLMLPVSVTALLLRIIFKLKLADIVINVTAGGPGGATDTVSSFIYRDYRDRSNVGYGTAGEFYLVLIIIFLTVLLACQSLDAKTRRGGERSFTLTAYAPTLQKIGETSAWRSAPSSSSSRVLIYGALLFWAFVCLFPIYWTITTSFKIGRRRDAGPPDPVARLSARLEGMALARPVARHALRDIDRARRIPARFENSIITSLGASILALVLGSLAAYGLSRFSYKFGPWRTTTTSLLLHLAADPAAGRPRAALPRPLQGAGAPRHALRPDHALHPDRAPDRDLDHARPVQFSSDRARRGGAGRRLSVWGAFLRIVLPLALPGHGGRVHPLARPLLERVFLRRTPHQHRRQQHACQPAGQTDSKGSMELSPPPSSW